MIDKDFKEDVRRFAKCCAGEYANNDGVTCEFTEDNSDYPRGELRFKDCAGEEWRVPVTVEDFGGAAIDIGDAGFLNLDSGGFYCYLWHEACRKLRVAQNALVNGGDKK